MTLDQLNSSDTLSATQWFTQTCAAQRWVDAMVSARPYASQQAVTEKALEVWLDMAEADYLEAFQAHPFIGDIDSLKSKFANTKDMAGKEQSGAADADEETLEKLGALNKAYLDRFGFIFIICATGQSAEAMLAALEQRIDNSRDTELDIAAAEQIKITLLRINKNLGYAVKNSLSSHVLDTTSGRPAKDMKLCLTTPDKQTYPGVTNDDGRCRAWDDVDLVPGVYTMQFATGDYLVQHHGKSFYPTVDIHFEIEANGGHYHIPLLISPFGFSSYRGS